MKCAASLVGKAPHPVTLGTRHAVPEERGVIGEDQRAVSAAYRGPIETAYCALRIRPVRSQRSS